MTHYDKRKLTEMVLYILNSTGGLDYYRIFKVLYFANVEHLVKYGFPMVPDKFCALQDGPVPSELYNCIKNDSFCDRELRDMLYDGMARGADDARYMLTPTRETNLECLSKADIEALDNSIRDNATLKYSELREKSHGNEWRRAYAQSGRKPMNVVGMAKDGNASDAMIEYIKENLAIDAALS